MINLKIGSRLIIGFLSIALLLGVVSVISFMQLSQVEKPLTVDIPRSLTDIERTSRLDSIAQRIRYFDQVLTDSAKDYTRTGDRRWKSRYETIEPQLDKLIKEAIKKGDAEDRKTFSDVQKAKLAFVEFEKQAIKAVDRDDKTYATIILEQQSYWQSKDEYKSSLQDYVERRGKKYTETLEVTTSQVTSIVQKTYELVRQSMRLLINVSFISIILALILGLLVSRSIIKPIHVLQQGAGIIGKGNLAYKITVESNDEIGELAEAFNDMTRKLSESYTILEDKVRERTRDLTDAKARLEQDKVQSEALLTSLGEGMIAMDPEGKIIKINTQAEKMFGWRAHEAIGHPYAELIRLEDEKGIEVRKEKDPLSLALSASRSVVMTTYVVRKDKTRFPALMTVSPVVLGKIIIGAIAIARDITKEKEIEKMKNEFVSTVSHELRTPLTIIKEFVSLVNDGVAGKVNEKQKKFLSTATSNIDRLSRIINDLLDISKIEAGKVVLNRSFIDIRKFIQEIVENYQGLFQQKNITLQTSFGPDLPKLYIDRDKMIQVFTNLIGNALKFTPAHGLVVVVAVFRNDSIIFSVSDTGPGISKENLKKTFGKFEQFGRSDGSGGKGTGLGLAISKGLVELHGGRVKVESELNMGTKFSFSIPHQTEDELFKAEVIRRYHDNRQRFSATSVIKIWLPAKDSSATKKEAPNGDIFIKIQGVLRNTLRSSSDELVPFNHGSGMALILEGDSQVASDVQKRVEMALNLQSIDKIAKLKRISTDEMKEDDFFKAVFES